MKIVVLVVRVVGIVLLIYGCYSAYMISSFESLAPGPQGLDASPIGSMFGAMTTRMEVISFVTAGIGLVLTLFAAPVCRLLTFDYKEKQ